MKDGLERGNIIGYLEKLPFRPNSSLQEMFYPRNISYMPAVKFYLRLGFERKF
jgi:hypothetical protein